MAITNYERVGKTMELLKVGLAPFVEREFKRLYKGQALIEAQRVISAERLDTNRPFAAWDVALLLRLMWDAWHEVFRKTLGQAERTLVSELREVRNRTESLQRLLVGAVQRLAGQGGDPVVQLQTNFGGGKTHSMLARYHLFSGVEPRELPGIDRVMQEAGATTLPTARRVVLVGNKISPGNPVTKPDGTVVRTLWGELAWQLGGAQAFARLRADDEQATSPGDVLRALFNTYGPCLILIDEWADYEQRLRAAYPIHPEVFDRLYTDWSTLVKFQRTRGVLRLMAAVIHSLWEKGDRTPLIQPATIPIDDPRVQFELTRYLSDHWVPILEKDVDGPNSLPLRLDGEVPNLGKFAACRRVARTIYLGSAPTTTAANRGLEDRRVKLGCVMPGESPAVFGDALRRLAAAATYLYQDGPRYWYATQPTVTKLAEDRAEQLRRDPDTVIQEVEKRLRADLRTMGDFTRIHPLPGTSADVPDDRAARLVVGTLAR